MNSENISEVVDLLVGKINPVGETNEDEKRLENIKKYIEITGYMLDRLDFIVFDYENRHEASVKEIRQEAYRFLLQQKKGFADFEEETVEAN